MKLNTIIYIIMAAAITSCTSAYKMVQTPDDVYYSPARTEGVAKENKQDKYEEYVSSQDDQYLHMKVRDRQRWSAIDDYAYWNDSRYYSLNYYGGNYGYNRYNPYAWNNWYQPFYSPFYSPGLSIGYGNFYGYYNPFYSYAYRPIYITKYPVKAAPNVNRPNLGGYSNNRYNNTNTRQGFGNSLKRVFSTDNNGYSNRNSGNDNTYRAPERSYSPSSSNSGSSSSSSSGGGRVSRPSRN